MKISTIRLRHAHLCTVQPSTIALLSMYTYIISVYFTVNHMSRDKITTKFQEQLTEIREQQEFGNLFALFLSIVY